MKTMEEALHQSNQSHKINQSHQVNQSNQSNYSNGDQKSRWEDPEPERPIPEEALATIICRGATARPQVVTRSNGLQFPAKHHATALVLGYFASYNHMFPIWCKREFMARMKEEYPPDKHVDSVWWSAVVVVLCFAHRLRAMSNVLQAETENHEACRYLQEALDMAPKLAFARASIGSAQVLLGLASILRGTAMPDQAPMLVAVAIRMLQDLNVHKQPAAGSSSRDHKISERTFWFAYIMDKDISLQSRKPPVLHEEDIGLGPLAHLEEDGIGTVRSLDSSMEFNLFKVARDLACIQGHVWTRIHSVAATVDRRTLEAAQAELNPVLATWKNSLPFHFKADDLVGRWPKHAVLHIVILHFRYFQTLVELNREPPMGDDTDDDMNPLNGNCPIAKSLPSYPHSTSTIAVEAARDALDLAALTPRGNFQNVW